MLQLVRAYKNIRYEVKSLLCAKVTFASTAVLHREKKQKIEENTRIKADIAKMKEAVEVRT